LVEVEVVVTADLLVTQLVLVLVEVEVVWLRGQ
jgi:hypothetical protein